MIKNTSNILPFSVLALSGTLLLSACGGSGSSATDDSNTATASNTGTNGGGSNNGSGSITAISWSNAQELTDGSLTVDHLQVNTAGSKPLIGYSSGAKFNTREFDGTNWTGATALQYVPSQIASFRWSNNDKGVIAYTRSTTLASNNTKACNLYFKRYNATQWDSEIMFRRLGGTSNYYCSTVKDLTASALTNGGTVLMFNRVDSSNGSRPGRYIYCPATGCTTGIADTASTLGTSASFVSAAGGDDKAVVLYKSGTQLIATTISSTRSSNNQLSPNSANAVTAMNSSNHAVALFNEGSDLKARYFNGSNWNSAVSVGDTVNTSNTGNLTLKQYMSKTADYALSVWNNGTLNSGKGGLRTNLYASGGFQSVATNHVQNPNYTVSTRFAAAINNNGKAVIAWLEAASQSGSGTLYARVYDGTEWKSVQTIDNDVDVQYFTQRGSSVGVHLDDSDQATLVYLAKSPTQSTTEPRLLVKRAAL